ncbi:hypothetical protein FISHEDRAFT_78779 [Fistulina hepatica ATCC 64428]|uniref:Uncharacterized protein n=1 Tax=Fistulina hepatica ATCC 64428 TaxID=1128425 RepID=A0A0D6ZZX9_9AGAR|nr:hypothetical protein FISHEDRAFT_78779 [Fistulina hepatica ATCC 64428]
MNVPLFCSYDDGTCERFESPYTGFPLVRTTALPTYVLFGMRLETILISEMRRMCYACVHLHFVTDIYQLWSKSFPHKFYWGLARKSFLHPRSVDSYCHSDDDRQSQSCKSSRSCALEDVDSVICCRVAPSALDSGSDTTDGAVEIIDVVRIDVWRRQVADYTPIRMPDLETPPSTIADATMLTTRTLNYRPTPECHVGWSSDIDTSHYTSNDWAIHKLGTSLWVVGSGSTRKQAQKKLRATKRVRCRSAKSMALASRPAAIPPVLPNERASDVCASLEQRHSTDRVDCRVTSGLDVDDVAISRNVKHLLDKIAPPRIRFSRVQVTSRKRQRDIEDITRIEPPRKRANCHW